MFLWIEAKVTAINHHTIEVRDRYIIGHDLTDAR